MFPAPAGALVTQVTLIAWSVTRCRRDFGCTAFIAHLTAPEPGFHSALQTLVLRSLFVTSVSSSRNEPEDELLA